MLEKVFQFEEKSIQDRLMIVHVEKRKINPNKVEILTKKSRTSIFLISPQSGASTEKLSTDLGANPSLPMSSNGIFSETLSVPMKTMKTLAVVPSSSLSPVTTRTVYGIAVGKKRSNKRVT